ncbi:hypothetical protein [Nigerium massiliense]|uniref:hypothetical protein n=1 Tax=Nigerium massiliense TaxID=1522317 RepID=UPI00058D4BCF|nr:hypothetical protein [Nigerium massiliense]
MAVITTSLLCLAAGVPAAQAAPGPTAWSGWQAPERWQDPASTIGWRVSAASVTAGTVGSDITLTADTDPSTRIDCATLGIGHGKAGGWRNLTPVRKECSPARASVTVRVDQAMVGGEPALTARSQPTAAEASYTLTGTVQVGAAPKATLRATAARPANASVPPTGGAGADPSLTSLSRVPWEGGAAYYQRFPDAVRGGWADAHHFPIGLWWGVASSDAEMKADMGYGINTYVITNPDSDPAMFERTGMDYIGTALPGQKRRSAAWVGDFLSDEVDGRYEPAAGQQHLADTVNALPDHQKIVYTNFTGMVISWFANNPAWDKASLDFVNKYTDAVSLDSYWFSGYQCDQDEPHGGAYLTPFTKSQCRTSQNYGRTVKSLRARDAADGKLQPVWNFVENTEVAPDGYSTYRLSPAQVKGAAMSSLINEARGLVWFNNSFGGACAASNAIRQAQTKPGYACKPQVEAMGEVNRQIQRLAPVLNTQSYAFTFGDGLETMLKAHDGYAYIFAMSTDDHAPGSRTFALPRELQGKTVEVVDEGRTLQAKQTFTDTFATHDSYHIYRVKLA